MKRNASFARNYFPESTELKRYGAHSHLFHSLFINASLLQFTYLLHLMPDYMIYGGTMPYEDDEKFPISALAASAQMNFYKISTSQQLIYHLKAHDFLQANVEIPRYATKWAAM